MGITDCTAHAEYTHAHAHAHTKQNAHFRPSFRRCRKSAFPRSRKGARTPLVFTVLVTSRHFHFLFSVQAKEGNLSATPLGVRVQPQVWLLSTDLAERTSAGPPLQASYIALPITSKALAVVCSAVVHMVNDDGWGSSERQPVCSLRQHPAFPTSFTADVLVQTAPCLLQEPAKARLHELPPKLVRPSCPLTSRCASWRGQQCSHRAGWRGRGRARPTMSSSRSPAMRCG